MDLTTQAIHLNTTLEQEAPIIFSMLSDVGKRMFFPKGGIMQQSQEAKGSDINATIGIALEDDGTPMHLHSIQKNHELDAADVYPYAYPYGKQELRTLWKERLFTKNPSLSSCITTPVVTNALTQGLTITAQLFLNPGDEIITPDLFWGNYKLTFNHLLDLEFRTFNTFDAVGFDCDALREAIHESTADTKVILLNFPNNPTGYSITTDEAYEIRRICIDAAVAGDSLVVICDDAYFGLSYEDNCFKESLFALLADAHERILAVKIDGASKEDFAWGIRVGFLTFGNQNITKSVASALEDKAAGILRASISNVTHIGQSLLLHAYQSSSYEVEKKQKITLLETRYRAAKHYFETHDVSDVGHPLPFNAGYFFSFELDPLINAEEIRRTLLEEKSTGIIAQGNLLRIAYSCLPASDVPVLLDTIFETCRKHSLVPA